MSEELIEIKDSYWTIAGESEGNYSEKRSKFLSFAYPVTTEEEALRHVASVRSLYYDARHVCWAYRLGADGDTTRANDDGEPSGTAGKPILGIITSLGLTEVIVLVVRYFGGIKLGVSGLITAYKTTAQLTLQEAEIEERTIDLTYKIIFDYKDMNKVMKIIKDRNLTIVSQTLELNCTLLVEVRKAEASYVEQLFEQLYEVTIEKLED